MLTFIIPLRGIPNLCEETSVYTSPQNNLCCEWRKVPSFGCIFHTNSHLPALAGIQIRRCEILISHELPCRGSATTQIQMRNAVFQAFLGVRHSTSHTILFQIFCPLHLPILGQCIRVHLTAHLERQYRYPHQGGLFSCVLLPQVQQ